MIWSGSRVQAAYNYDFHGVLAKKLRRLVLYGFKVAGVGRQETEECFRERARIFCQFLKSKAEAGLPVSWEEVERKSLDATASIIHELLLGSDFEPAIRRTFSEGITGFFKFGGSASGILNYWPWLRFLIPGGMGYARYKAMYLKLIDYCLRQVRSLDSQPIDPSNNCLIAQLLRKRNQDHDADLTDDMLAQIVADLFITGQDTVAVAIQWCLPLLAGHPELQQRLYDEIAENLAPSESAWTHRDKVPLLTAFMWELQRYTTEASHLPHSCDTDTYIRGHFIPKGTIINYNVSYVARSEKNFQNSAEFIPERFLDSETGEVTGVDGVIPFGYGKRLCVGEHLARVEMHVFFREIIEHFKFEPLPGASKPLLLPQMQRLVLQPVPYKLAVVQRNG